MKGICRVCKEIVPVKALIFSAEARETIKGDFDKPFYLCISHPPKEGCAVGEIVSQSTGVVLEKHCNGTHRPPLELYQEH